MQWRSFSLVYKHLFKYERLITLANISQKSSNTKWRKVYGYTSDLKFHDVFRAALLTCTRNMVQNAQWYNFYWPQRICSNLLEGHIIIRINCTGLSYMPMSAHAAENLWKIFGYSCETLVLWDTFTSRIRSQNFGFKIEDPIWSISS